MLAAKLRDAEAAAAKLRSDASALEAATERLRSNLERSQTRADAAERKIKVQERLLEELKNRSDAAIDEKRRALDERG